MLWRYAVADVKAAKAVETSRSDALQDSQSPVADVKAAKAVETQ